MISLSQKARAFYELDESGYRLQGQADVAAQVLEPVPVFCYITREKN